MISDYVKRKRTINTLLLLFMFLSGIGFSAAGIYSIAADVTATPDNSVMVRQLADSCERNIRQSGMIVNRNGLDIEAFLYELPNPKDTVYKTSLAFQQCLGYQVTNVCIGQECGDKFYSVTLDAVGG